MSRIFTVSTDAFTLDDFEADSLDEAIAIAFEGEGLRIKDEQSLFRRFPQFVDDGGWCWIECDGVRIIELGAPN